MLLALFKKQTSVVGESIPKCLYFNTSASVDSAHPHVKTDRPLIA